MTKHVLVIMGLVHGMSMAQTVSQSESVLLAFGDVNLGRQVGQRIFDGHTRYPFEKAIALIEHGDIVFANLESPLTDQGGETRHPTDGYRFCGPRAGALTLLHAGIDVVSGANNHMYDYGKRGLAETLSSLSELNIPLVGVRGTEDESYPRIITTSNGLRIGFVAYTEFVNRKGAWKKHVALFERKRIRDDIAWLKSRTDLVVASYHGGTEYTPEPPRGTRRNLRFLADAGADFVLGHHPHVPQGVEVRGRSTIFYSLGNFVFYQPQRYWTQIGLAACIHLKTGPDASRTTDVHLIPFRAGLQPSRTLESEALDSLEHRFRSSSPAPLRRVGTSFVLEDHDHTHF